MPKCVRIVSFGIGDAKRIIKVKRREEAYVKASAYPKGVKV